MINLIIHNILLFKKMRVAVIYMVLMMTIMLGVKGDNAGMIGNILNDDESINMKLNIVNNIHREE